MKKRILAIVLCCVMSVAMLTGCGSEAETTTTDAGTQVEDTDAEEEAEEEDAAGEESSSEGCSDESFQALQEAYVYLTEEYNAIEDAYVNTEAIPQDDDVEEALNLAKQYLDELGEVDQSEISEAEAEEVAQSMLDVAEGLAKLAEAFDIVVDSAAAGSDSDAGEGCSDETFGYLQDEYAALVEVYNTVTDYYVNDDSIAQDDEVEEYLNAAKNAIEQAGEVQQSDISEEDAVDLANLMADLAENLAAVADAL